MENQKYRLIAFDLDGTLLNEKMLLTDYTIKEVKKIASSGIKCTIISSRMLNNILDVTRELSLSYIAALEGGVIYDVGKAKIEKKEPIDDSTVKKLIDRLIQREDVVLNLFTLNNVYISKFCKVKSVKIYQETLSPKFLDKFLFDEDVYGFHIVIENDNIFNNIFDELKESYKDLIFKDGNFNFIIVNKVGINKGGALKYIAERLNIPLDNTVALGDSHSDISMIKEAGLGIAMKNGDERLKAIADEITDEENSSNGAIKYLLKRLKLCN